MPTRARTRSNPAPGQTGVIWARWYKLSADRGLGNDSQTSDLTDNYIYGGTGISELYGGPGYNYIQGGSGTEDIYAGAGSNLIYGGSGGTSSVPDYIYGNASGTMQATESTIYGGTGYEVIRGGPGSDLVYAGQGTGDRHHI